ncbi:MAG TPA: glycosyltransferase family 2 protein [Candidatus Eisenbacteria bacterium]|nr:glycosyltransferase family 2 protein [Candidatus Eisenbacteria bacterium]
MKVDVSVVVPAYNEAESLPELVTRVRDVLSGRVHSWEMLVVDDGSTDATRDVLRSLAAQTPELRYRSFRRNYGKSAALAVGFESARGDRIITMDADLQDDPAEIPALLDALDQGWDLVSGWKRVRHDPMTKTVPSRLFNRVTSAVSGIRLHDFNCGLKAYRGEVAHDLPVYGELHRFLPAVAHWRGYRVTEIPVRHHPRRHGTSKFGSSRFVNGFLDLLTVTFVHSGRQSPLHVFGRIGLWLGLIGGGIFTGFVVSWILGNPIRTRPIFFIALILIILAIQFISLGLLGELVVKGQSRPVIAFREDD